MTCVQSCDEHSPSYQERNETISQLILLSFYSFPCGLSVKPAKNAQPIFLDHLNRNLGCGVQFVMNCVLKVPEYSYKVSDKIDFHWLCWYDDVRAIMAASMNQLIDVNICRIS
jgi:hypothetical protein